MTDVSLSLIDGVARAHFDPRLYMPFEIGSRIVTGDYGDVMRVSGSNGGSIDFALGRSRFGAYARTSDPEIWPYLDLAWKGRTFRIYQGERTTEFEDLDLVYTGRIDDLTHDTLKASVKVTDGSVDLDDALVSDLYPDDDTVPETIRGRPKPEVRGAVYNIAPVLLTDTDLGAPLVYQVSRLPLADVMDLRVGGIPWDRVTVNPIAGQWSVDLATGKITLGGITGGLDVRCDARGVGWETMTTAKLMSDLIIEAGGVADTEAMEALDAAAPYLIGWFTGAEEVNRLNAFDEIMTSILGWWGVDIDSRFAAGVLDAPAASADLSLDGVTIETFQLSGMLPPAWRIRVEHSRNWSPLSSFAEAVTEADKKRWEDAGKIAPAWTDNTIKREVKRSVDMPLIRSLVLNEADALAIRDRASRMFGVARRLYDVKARIDAPELYRTASVDYLMVSGDFRVHAVTRSFGGSASTTLQMWG